MMHAFKKLFFIFFCSSFYQIGEEMSQNSFIQQYLAKQQELLRQKMEREAQQDDNAAGTAQTHKHKLESKSSPCYKGSGPLCNTLLELQCDLPSTDVLSQCVTVPVMCPSPTGAPTAPGENEEDSSSLPFVSDKVSKLFTPSSILR